LVLILRAYIPVWRARATCSTDVSINYTFEINTYLTSWGLIPAATPGQNAARLSMARHETTRPRAGRYTYM